MRLMFLILVCIVIGALIGHAIERLGKPGGTDDDPEDR
jgi:hypothetical protein